MLLPKYIWGNLFFTSKINLEQDPQLYLAAVLELSIIYHTFGDIIHEHRILFAAYKVAMRSQAKENAKVLLKLAVSFKKKLEL